jgi:hypothetical protein
MGHFFIMSKRYGPFFLLTKYVCYYLGIGRVSPVHTKLMHRRILSTESSLF